MKNIFYILVLFITVAIGFVSCNSEAPKTIEVDNGSSFYPLTIGSTFEYRLDSILYDDFDNSETKREWDLKITYDSKLKDQSGDDLIKLKRFIKPRGEKDEAYKLQDVWSLKLVNGKLETFEENLHFVKLVFPIEKNKSWNGNIFISPSGGENPNSSTKFYQDWDYKYETTNTTQTVLETTYNDVVQVRQINEIGGPGAINHYVSNEWYAKGIGLIQKRMEMIVENCPAEPCSEKTLPVLQRTKKRKGFILDLKLIRYDIK